MFLSREKKLYLWSQLRRKSAISSAKAGRLSPGVNKKQMSLEAHEAQLQNLALISGAPRYRVLRRRSGQDSMTTMHNTGWTNHFSGLV